MDVFFRPLFWGYRYFISPVFLMVFGVACRYEESCSRYSERMFLRHGLVRGSYYSLIRVLSCNPWGLPKDRGKCLHG